MNKTLFINTIEAIRLQMADDKNYSFLLGELLKSEVGLYDNSKLIKSLLDVLHIHFPKDENGFSEIEHYCFDLGFGKIGEDEYLSVDDLWCRVTSPKVTVQDIEDFKKACPSQAHIFNTNVLKNL